ncbi:MAG: hypothetical protein GX434_10555 [Peptococcaceae bacterium]|nr:hypothetical protein [Peptococcaceae bacterium]
MSAITQSLQLMLIGLPIMFGVILLFMGLTVLITKVFPYKPEEEEEDAEG